jgi:hypothetical protein
MGEMMIASPKIVRDASKGGQKGKRTHWTISVEATLAERFDAVARKMSVSRSMLITMAIRNVLQNGVVLTVGDGGWET